MRGRIEEVKECLVAQLAERLALNQQVSRSNRDETASQSAKSCYNIIMFNLFGRSKEDREAREQAEKILNTTHWEARAKCRLCGEQFVVVLERSPAFGGRSPTDYHDFLFGYKTTVIHHCKNVLDLPKTGRAVHGVADVLGTYLVDNEKEV